MAAPRRNDFERLTAAPREEDQGRTQSRRLLALAEVYDGGSRTDASRSAASVCRSFATGCCASTPADRTGWSMHPEAQRRSPRALAEVVEAGPVPAVDGVVRWRRKDLARWLLETFAISLDETTVGRRRSASPRSRRGRATTRKTSWPCF